ncbi:MAG: UbiA family prenyltransferase [Methanobrevibacter sp.]|nr:UbiA family prenyltransferase [Candidatus Methanovirga australis]
MQSNKFKAYITLTRPFNTFLLMLIVLMTPYIIGNKIDFNHAQFNLFLTTLSFGCISAGSYVLNDYYDINIDKINKPNKSIPMGVISLIEAKRFGTILICLGILISLFINLSIIILLVIYTLILQLYNMKYKKSIFKNIIIGVACSFSIVLGASVINKFNSIFLIFLIFIIIFTISREIYKDIEDIDGDRSFTNTIPLHLGTKTAMCISSFLLILIIILSPILYCLGLMNLNYVLIIFSVDILLLYCIYIGILNFKTEHKKLFRKMQKLCKICMTLAFLGLILGRI